MGGGERTHQRGEEGSRIKDSITVYYVRAALLRQDARAERDDRRAVSQENKESEFDTVTKGKR